MLDIAMTEKLRTILYSRHKSLKAAMTDFAGWEMPLYYSGITDEHLHTRSKVGLFDLSHMGRFLIRGKGFRDLLDWLTPAAISTAPDGKVLYSFLLNENGGVIDDITIYVGRDYAFLVVNASNREKDLKWLRRFADEFPTVEIEDLSQQLGMLAIQGPLAQNAMEHVLGESFTPCPYYTFQEVQSQELPPAMRSSLTTAVRDFPALLYSATGYTGELGYEIYAVPELIQSLWDKFISEAPVLELKPVGLGARDSLRLEAAMPLYGHELTEEISPLEAGLGRFVDFTKPVSFIGREALALQREHGVQQKLVGLEMVGKGAVPRQGCSVMAPEGGRVGYVTSGAFSPTLRKNIALAYVSPSHAAVGASLQVEIRDRLWPAGVVKRPFYRRSQ